MPGITPLSKSSLGYINTLFILLIIAYAILGYFLLWELPYTFPFGGPDEPMHLSMANYIAEHLSWPQWDSKEVITMFLVEDFI